MVLRNWMLALVVGCTGGVVTVAIAQDSGGVATIDCSVAQQVVDGFGFSTAWTSLPGGAANIDAFFSRTKGAGLSIVRNRIPFNESPSSPDRFIARNGGAHQYTSVSDAQGAYKVFDLNWDTNWDLQGTRKLLDAVKANPDYQLSKVFSTPWTTPNNAVERWKLPTDASSKAKNRLTEATYSTHPEIGGSLDPAHYQDYADVLADYVLGFKAHMGVELYALSLQNEPSFDCGYESCDWTGQQFHDFLLVLKQEFGRKGVAAACPNLKIMAPEDNNFRDSLLREVYADPATRDMVEIAAGHQYEYGPWSIGNRLTNLFTERDAYRPDPFAASFGYGKQVWMSEWSLAAFSRASEIKQALVLAKVIAMDFTRSHLNGFVFWWSGSLLGDKGPGKGLPTKNLWALGQFSRFVRPGWRVLSATPAPASGVYLAAFAEQAGGAIAIVAVNTNDSAKEITLALSGGAKLGNVSLYRTSERENMADVGPVTVNGGSEEVTLTPFTISTFCGNVIP